MSACFDARLVIFPIDGEIINHMIWRSNQDCERNAISTFSRSEFSQLELNSKKKQEMILMLLDKGIDWK